MAIQAGVGISHHRNPKVAGQDAVAQALASANIDTADFVLMFASVGYNQTTLLNAVNQATGHAPLCGCSGEGIITRGVADESNFSVAVMTLASDTVRFANGMASGLAHDSMQVGHAIASAVHIQQQGEPRGLLLFADGLTCNFDALQAGIEHGLHEHRHIPLLGGLAADNWQTKQTYQYYNDLVFSDGVSWALLSGDVDIVSSVNHGCITIGVEHTITRCDGSTIYEIDNRPARDILREYLSEDEVHNWAVAMANLCLGFRAPAYMQGYDEYIIRFVPNKDESAGSLSIPTNVTPGTSVWLTRRDYDKIAAGIDLMTNHLVQQLETRTPWLILHFDCAGRGKVIFTEEQKLKLLAMLQDKVAPGVPWIGFHTYGEIGPVSTHNCFHNYTAVIAALC